MFSILYAQSEDATKSTQNVSLVATSNVFAEYYDCGCPKAPLGGLARKAFFFKHLFKLNETKPSSGQIASNNYMKGKKRLFFKIT